jgi:hypothetical protein
MIMFGQIIVSIKEFIARVLNNWANI